MARLNNQSSNPTLIFRHQAEHITHRTRLKFSRKEEDMIQAFLINYIGDAALPSCPPDQSNLSTTPRNTQLRERALGRLILTFEPLLRDLEVWGLDRKNAAGEDVLRLLVVKLHRKLRNMQSGTIGGLKLGVDKESDSINRKRRYTEVDDSRIDNDSDGEGGDEDEDENRVGDEYNESHHCFSSTSSSPSRPRKQSNGRMSIILDNPLENDLLRLRDQTFSVRPTTPDSSPPQARGREAKRRRHADATSSPIRQQQSYLQQPQQPVPSIATPPSSPPLPFSFSCPFPLSSQAGIGNNHGSDSGCTNKPHQEPEYTHCPRPGSRLRPRYGGLRLPLRQLPNTIPDGNEDGNGDIIGPDVEDMDIGVTADADGDEQQRQSQQHQVLGHQPVEVTGLQDSNGWGYEPVGCNDPQSSNGVWAQDLPLDLKQSAKGNLIHKTNTLQDDFWLQFNGQDAGNNAALTAIPDYDANFNYHIDDALDNFWAQFNNQVGGNDVAPPSNQNNDANVSVNNAQNVHWPHCTNQELDAIINNNTAQNNFWAHSDGQGVGNGVLSAVGQEFNNDHLHSVPVNQNTVTNTTINDAQVNSWTQDSHQDFGDGVLPGFGQEDANNHQLLAPNQNAIDALVNALKDNSCAQFNQDLDNQNLDIDQYINMDQEDANIEPPFAQGNDNGLHLNLLLGLNEGSNNTVAHPVLPNQAVKSATANLFLANILLDNNNEDDDKENYLIANSPTASELWPDLNHNPNSPNFFLPLPGYMNPLDMDTVPNTKTSPSLPPSPYPSSALPPISIYDDEEPDFDVNMYLASNLDLDGDLNLDLDIYSAQNPAATAIATANTNNAPSCLLPPSPPSPSPPHNPTPSSSGTLNPFPASEIRPFLTSQIKRDGNDPFWGGGESDVDAGGIGSGSGGWGWSREGEVEYASAGVGVGAGVSLVGGDADRGTEEGEAEEEEDKENDDSIGAFLREQGLCDGM